MGSVTTSHDMGLHEEQLTGRTQQRFFSASEEENFVYPWSYEVDIDKSDEFDAADMEISDINIKIRDLMKSGVGTITVHNPRAKHSLGVGILNRLNLNFEGSLGYFGCGVIDGPNVHISGRVGWSCAENMMAGTVVIEKNAGSLFGAAIRGGDLVCKGQAGARVGIDQKGGTIIVGESVGAFTGFMMQRGRMIILGDASDNLGDSMYDGTIYVGGKIASLGVDCVETEMTDLDKRYLEGKLSQYGMSAPNGVDNMIKLTSGKQLWNYDNLEPTEKKLVL
ncbi:MAG: GXGXG motif-containing protein [Gammaproteobacteria bacterium]|nr:GXGXG motif-containing protein [Gammaproteobacteria bacterium]MCP4765734.1 GXGXG motif-containing protein [Gammaproteobacteria bacterium]